MGELAQGIVGVGYPRSVGVGYACQPVQDIVGILGELAFGVAKAQEVTILADRDVPFNVIKRVMSTCTQGGYSRISLAVLQKAPESQLSSL